jgi:tetratricopeptide (TPR) repeat protein
VSAQLTNVADGYHRWSERYDREMANVFDIQDEIVSSIVKALAPALLEDAKDVVPRSTENPEAYELYLKGRHYWHQRWPGTLRLAIQCFEHAITADSTYALAYAGLADCYGILRSYGWVPAADSRPHALKAVTRAMHLASGLAEANFSRGFFTYYFEPAWHQAEVDFKTAIAMNPRWSLAQAYYGLYLACDYRFDEAVTQVDVGRELDPLSPFVHGLASVVLALSRRFEAAEEAARRALELQPDYLTGLWGLAQALYGLGRVDEGISAMEHVVMLSRAPIFVGMLGLGYARGGDVGRAMQLLHELDERRSRGEYVVPFAPLAIHVGLRDVDAVRNALETCIAEQTPVLSVRMTCGAFLEEFREDAPTDLLLDRLHDGAKPLERAPPVIQ